MKELILLLFFFIVIANCESNCSGNADCSAKVISKNAELNPQATTSPEDLIAELNNGTGVINQSALEVFQKVIYMADIPVKVIGETLGQNWEEGIDATRDPASVLKTPLKDFVSKKIEAASSKTTSDEQYNQDNFRGVSVARQSILGSVFSNIGKLAGTAIDVITNVSTSATGLIKTAADKIKGLPDSLRDLLETSLKALELRLKTINGTVCSREAVSRPHEDLLPIIKAELDEIMKLLENEMDLKNIEDFFCVLKQVKSDLHAYFDGTPINEINSDELSEIVERLQSAVRRYGSRKPTLLPKFPIIGMTLNKILELLILHDFLNVVQFMITIVARNQ